MVLVVKTEIDSGSVLLSDLLCRQIPILTIKLFNEKFPLERSVN